MESNIIKTRVRKTRFANVKMPHRSRVFKTRVLCKKKISPILAFSSLTVTFLNPIAAFSCKKKFISTRFGSPIVVFLSPIVVLKPYSSIFLQFMEIESLKLDFHIDFFLPLNQSSYKSRLKNSSFRHSRC